VLFIRNPNPDATPQRLLREVERRCRARGWWEERVRLIDWVPAERRWDLLRDVDALVAPHRPSLETRLSMRTRFLEALAAGCPVVTSDGGSVSRLLREHRAGWVVPPSDAAAVADALEQVLTETAEDRAERERGAAELADRFSWDRVLAPLVAFCRSPRRDPTKEDFAFHPPTVAPPDGLAFRVGRFGRRWRRGVGRWLRGGSGGGR
jgi:hypothetical protein